MLFRSPTGNYVYGYLTNVTLTANTELTEQNQTGATGEYRYLLLPGSPTGSYRLEVTVPTGYVQRISTEIPPCTTSLTVGAASIPSLVQRLDTAPPTQQRIHDPASCPSTTAGLAIGADSTQYYLAFVLGATSTTGALLGVYKHINDNFRLGGGYNFTDYSDNITDLSNKSRGVFVNGLAQF